MRGRVLVRIFTVLALALLVGLVGCSDGLKSTPTPPPQRPPRVPSRREFSSVSYAGVSQKQQLDVLLPPTGDGPFPVLIYVHGGGYISGEKAVDVPGLTLLAHERGYAVVPIGYRLLDEAGWPAQIHDVKAAIRWVRSNADSYAFDRRRIAIWGTSAGGHLAALAGTSANVAELEASELGSAEASSAVDAVIDWFGPSDFLALERYLDGEGRTSVSAQQLDYIVEQVKQSPGSIRSANPASHADVSDPPILIQHGDLDDIVPLDQSTLLAEGLREKMPDEKVTLEVKRGAAHASAAFVTPQNLDHVLDWLDEALGR